MTDFNIELANISKNFGRRQIFRNLDFTLKTGQIYGIAGHNGAGKSTLVKIIAGVLTPNKGKLNWVKNGIALESEKYCDYLGYAAPYLILYDEFTAIENLHFLSGLRGNSPDNEYILRLLDEFKLGDRKDELLKGYSSGMKQRMKIISALADHPAVLIADEPVSNLDAEGKSSVYKALLENSNERITIIASNEQSDLDLCSEILSVENYKV